ncbi:MAG: hypothetical protein JWM11_2091 [Planctomycetaceae bacterium]|nr:hypothetical protein [Planctomycetaceae bacterium]
MRYMENPDQGTLFNVFRDILSPVAFNRLQQGWEQLFRLAILKLMPADKFARHFHPILGRPTKELYSMAGLIFIMEFRNWTQEEAVEAYSFHANIQYALNLDPEGQSLCERTLQRYLQNEEENRRRHDLQAVRSRRHLGWSQGIGISGADFRNRPCR